MTAGGMLPGAARRRRNTRWLNQVAEHQATAGVGSAAESQEWAACAGWIAVGMFLFVAEGFVLRAQPVGLRTDGWERAGFGRLRLAPGGGAI